MLPAGARSSTTSAPPTRHAVASSTRSATGNTALNDRPSLVGPMCRLTGLRLASHLTFATKVRGSITWIALDRTEQQFVLIAAQDGSIECFSAVVRPAAHIPCPGPLGTLTRTGPQPHRHTLLAGQAEGEAAAVPN